MEAARDWGGSLDAPLCVLALSGMQAAREQHVSLDTLLCVLTLAASWHNEFKKA